MQSKESLNDTLDLYDYDYWNDDDYSGLDSIPEWRQILWVVLFGIIAVTGTIGNLIVVWIVLAHRIMRSVTNMFIVNLAVADGMVALLNVTITAYNNIYFDWPFGLILCKLSEFIPAINISVSALTLAAISIDRYISIMKPFRRKMGKWKSLLIIGAIWTTSFVVSVPKWIFFTITNVVLDADYEQTITCYSRISDNTVLEKFQEPAFAVIFIVITFFLPLSSMIFTYGRIGKQLWVNHSIGERTHIQIRNIQAKRKVVKMMVVVVLIFTVCWFPYHISNIVFTLTGQTWSSVSHELYMAFLWLTMSSSMYNPIIYCWMNDKFREGFKKFFRWLPYVNYTPGKILRDSNISNGTSLS